MGTYTDNGTWVNSIYLLELTDPVEGGPDGISNLQAKQLADRTAWLKTAVEGKVDQVSGKGLSTNDFTDALKTKLNGVTVGANNYALPQATASTLGGVKSGTDVLVDAATGVVKLGAASAAAVAAVASGQYSEDITVEKDTSRLRLIGVGDPSTPGTATAPGIILRNKERADGKSVLISPLDATDLAIQLSDSDSSGHTGVSPLLKLQDGVLYAYSEAVVMAPRNITAGSGLTGGGDLSSDRTLTMGTPGTLNGDTSNAATVDSHTHAVSAASETLKGVVELATAAETTAGTDTSRAVTPAGLKVELDKKPPTSRTISSGDGLIGGGDLSSDRTLTMGTPGTVSGNTTNAVTATSHTHLVASASETVKGAVELATAAETAAGTDTTRAITPAGLKAELDKVGAHASDAAYHPFVLSTGLPVIRSTEGTNDLPFMLTEGRVFAVTDNGDGTITLDPDQAFRWRGTWKVSVNDYPRTFTHAADKVYHLRWTTSDGLVLCDLADPGYNPSSLPEEHDAFDSFADTMLIARVTTNGSNVPSIMAIKNTPFPQTNGQYHSTTGMVGTIDYTSPTFVVHRYSQFKCYMSQNQADSASPTDATISLLREDASVVNQDGDNILASRTFLMTLPLYRGIYSVKTYSETNGGPRTVRSIWETTPIHVN